MTSTTGTRVDNPRARARRRIHRIVARAPDAERIVVRRAGAPEFEDPVESRRRARGPRVVHACSVVLVMAGGARTFGRLPDASRRPWPA